MSNLALAVPRLDLASSLDFQFKSQGLKFDANETAAFARQLEWIQAEAIEVKYPEYKWRSLVPIKTGIPLGVRSHTFREVYTFGEAELLDNFAVEDFPTSEVQGKEVTGVIRSMGTRYAYTVEDMRAAQLMTIQVDAEKAKNARRVIESKFDKLVFAPNGGLGPFTGLYDDANATAVTPNAKSGTGTNYGGTGGSWQTATPTTNPSQMINDLQKLVDTAFVNTNGVFDQFDVIMTLATWTQLDQPYYTVDGNGVKFYTGVTIRQYILNNVGRIRSLDYNLRGTGVGAGATDRILAYPRDPQVLDCVVPIDFEQFAPQLSGMAFQIFCHAKYGGLRIHHPKAIVRMDLTP